MPIIRTNRAAARTMTKSTKIDQIAFAGRSGASYDFRVYVWETKFKAIPGVYVVASRTIEPGQPPQYQPLFIGQTADLSAALRRRRRSAIGVEFTISRSSTAAI